MCTENYELAQQEAVLFAKQHLALAAQNIERQQFIVPDIISCVAQAGYLGASIPQKYGGRGYDSYQLCALHGSDGWGSRFVRKSHNSDWHGQHAAATRGQRSAKSPLFAKAGNGGIDRRDCLTEPNIGSDLVNVETELQQDGDGWRLNGKKKMDHARADC